MSAPGIKPRFPGRSASNLVSGAIEGHAYTRPLQSRKENQSYASEIYYSLWLSRVCISDKCSNENYCVVPSATVTLKAFIK
jgi:hypothetical protein